MIGLTLHPCISDRALSTPHLHMGEGLIHLRRYTMQSGTWFMYEMFIDSLSEEARNWTHNIFTPHLIERCHVDRENLRTAVLSELLPVMYAHNRSVEKYGSNRFMETGHWSDNQCIFSSLLPRSEAVYMQ